MIFLRDFSCFAKIELILKLFEKAFSSKIKFSKSQTLWVGPYKNRIHKIGKWFGQNSGNFEFW